jgi:2-phosphosulfolactate phosphatase
LRVDVALTAEDAAALPLEGAGVLVVDVLRASTTIIAALSNGCVGVIPVGEPEEARARAAALPPGTALVAGERRGEPLEGFDLGNSPLEFTAERVRGKTVVLTTSNGTRALLAARRAPAVAVAGLVNLTAAAAWAAAAGRDVAVLCSGDRGRVSLEDQVCAGLLVGLLSASTNGHAVILTPAAAEARDVAVRYRGEPGRLALDSPWARHLTTRGRGADVAACLALDTHGLVPHLLPGVDTIVAGSRE